MKVSINQTLIDGPWGGGNRFLGSLINDLEANGHAVVHDLADDDVDVILMLDPRTRSKNITYGAGDILRYLAFRNPDATVVHRINECDERKGTRLMNFRLRLANYAADHTVFIATWLEKLSVWRRESDWSVILNGADTQVFHDRGTSAWDGKGPIRLVTHHWGANRLKGFDVYQMLDQMLIDDAWRDRIEFTYIGNLPDDCGLPNTRKLAPMDGEELASELRRHHIYITASINEPAGMHHVEGALCGMPLLYRSSGALPEYCDGFGEAFSGPDDFAGALGRIIERYPDYKAHLKDYDQTKDKMIAAFTGLFGDLADRRTSIRAARRIWRRPDIFLMNQIKY